MYKVDRVSYKSVSREPLTIYLNILILGGGPVHPKKNKQ